ncbi:UNVERIFIED_CONTAM: hypothetical protein Sindi_0543200 [Sesamum indicum]
MQTTGNGRGTSVGEEDDEDDGGRGKKDCRDTICEKQVLICEEDEESLAKSNVLMTIEASLGVTEIGDELQTRKDPTLDGDEDDLMHRPPIRV